MTEIILETDDKAANQVTVCLWKSAKGNLFSEERAARYDGCTHRNCNQCGKPTVKHHIICDECRVIKDAERYAALPTKFYRGDEPIYSERDDVYFFNDDDLAYYCDINDISTDNASLSNLRLVFCRETRAKEIDPNEYYCDELPEDGEVDGELLAAFDTLNKAIRAYKKPLSWSPSKVAVRFAGE